MGRLIFGALMSLDGYLEDVDGNIQWAAPDEEVMRFVNELERPVGTYLYGRRMYETMVFWESNGTLPDDGPLEHEFAEMWRAADKVVYSRSLSAASSARTRLERTFETTAVQALKETSQHDLTVAGPDLATQAFRAGLVDECQLFLVPTVVGGGKPALPKAVRFGLELIDEVRFRSGIVFLRYRVSSPETPGG